MNIPDTAAINLADLHADHSPVPPPVPTTASTTVVGRVNYARSSAPAKPQTSAPQALVNPREARMKIQEGLKRTLAAFSQLPQEERDKQLERLLRGASHTGFVTTATKKRVQTLDDLRLLIAALNRVTAVKLFGNAAKQLFFFTVPRGWLAYAGDVKVNSLVRYYQRKDKKMAAARAAWEKARDEAITNGTPVPPEAPEVKYTKVAGSGTEWGPWVTLLRNGTRPDFIEMLVPSANGVQREFKPVLVNENAPLQRARTLTFVIDVKTGVLDAWQAGRFVAEMSPAQRMDRVILAGDTPEEVEDEAGGTGDTAE